MQLKDTKLSEVMDGPWKDFSIYTIENRAIPSMIDGLKPVQRFLLYRGLRLSKFDRVSAVGSSLAEIGYHHGEASAYDALTAMGQTWSNNIPLFEGDGWFGNRAEPEAGAPRYIYVRGSKLLPLLFKDMDFCPKHEDEEHIPPKYYLPIIPMALVNGIKGIATGYATDIPPMNPLDIIADLKLIASGSEKRKKLRPKFPAFTGVVNEDPAGNRWWVDGVWKQVGANKIEITELPPGWTRDSYVEHLQSLVDKGIIVDFDDSTEDTFKFTVVLKKGTRWNINEVFRNLKLNTSITWNVTVLDENRKLRVYERNGNDPFSKLVKDFYQFRIDIVKQRIAKERYDKEQYVLYLRGLHAFITDVITGKFQWAQMVDTNAMIDALFKLHIPEVYISRVLDMPAKSFTKDKANKVFEEIGEVCKRLAYLEQTTPEKEYIADLDALESEVRKLG